MKFATVGQGDGRAAWSRLPAAKLSGYVAWPQQRAADLVGAQVTVQDFLANHEAVLETEIPETGVLRYRIALTAARS